MPANFIESIEEFEVEHGARLVVFKIRYKVKRNRLKRMMVDGMEIAIEAALVAYTWKSNFPPAWPVVLSLMGAVSVIDFFHTARRCLRELSLQKREKVRLWGYLSTSVISYFTTIHALSEALKRNNLEWKNRCLGVLAISYLLAASSVTKLGRTILNRTPFMKCCQLLFGPVLIWSAGFYLLCIRHHDEEWLLCLPMIASALVGNHIAFSGHCRVESYKEPRWLLFKGLEMLLGGCIMFLNGAVLVVYSMNNDLHPLFPSITFYAIITINGLVDIYNSLETFQRYVRMSPRVFRSIQGMIGGPIIFLLGCIAVKCINDPLITMPLFMVTAGSGITILGESVSNLNELVISPRLFYRYCQRVLGPVVIVYSSLASAYVGYHIGWKFSLVTMPLFAGGITVTYMGYRRRNQFR